MDLGDVVARLEPLQQHALALVYFHGRSTSDAAQLLAVERIVVATALAVAFRHIARWVMDGEDAEPTRFPPSLVTPTSDGAALRAAG